MRGERERYWFLVCFSLVLQSHTLCVCVCAQVQVTSTSGRQFLLKSYNLPILIKKKKNCKWNTERNREGKGASDPGYIVVEIIWRKIKSTNLPHRESEFSIFCPHSKTIPINDKYIWNEKKMTAFLARRKLIQHWVKPPKTDKAAVNATAL